MYIFELPNHTNNIQIMKKIFLLMSILISATFTSSCDMDNASIVGTWKTTQFDGVATFDGAEVYQYNLLKYSEINWTFTDLFYVNIDINWAGETHSVNAPFIYKPEHGVLTFLVAKCTDVVLYDNAITCNIEITGDLLNKFIPNLGDWDDEKNAYSLKIDGDEKYIDKVVIKARLEKTTAE